MLTLLLLNIIPVFVWCKTLELWLNFVSYYQNTGFDYLFLHHRLWGQSAQRMLSWNVTRVEYKLNCV